MVSMYDSKGACALSLLPFQGFWHCVNVSMVLGSPFLPFQSFFILPFKPVKDSNVTMTTVQWDAVNEFVKTVGWEFIFGLNSLLRNPYPVGVWDSTNGAQLMSYSTSKGYTVNWELGNGQSSSSL